MMDLIRKYKYRAIVVLLGILLFFSIPLPQFNAPASTIVHSKEGHLLGAKISSDEQWRFSLIDSVPSKFYKCITLFEDQWFDYHFGCNPFSIVRASLQNIKAKKVVSGASTITMQTIRLARSEKNRNLLEKFIELYFALRYEIKYTKNEIMKLYASHAPFGGNVVGLEAASWRYFNRSPENLSWAETATLAVLPNAPALIHPGRNRNQLKRKRNFLLKKLLKHQLIDSTSYRLSIAEQLPLQPKPLPHYASHFLDFVEKNHKGERVHSTLNFKIQNETRRMLNDHSKLMSSNEIHNAALVVVDNQSGNIVAYVGNSDYSSENANSVDVIRSPRSTGSIIKPLLYAFMLDDGELLPHTLIPDIPMFFEGFTPQNYNMNYDGAVKASEALSRSLNLPFIYMLKKYGIARFHNKLQQIGFTTLVNSPDYYGLSLILGGAETSLWELTQVYSGMARTLQSVPKNSYQYANTNFRALNYLKNRNQQESLYRKEKNILSAGAIWQSFEAMLELNRPGNQAGWRSYSSAKKIAWKTGTSFGFRDAWAIGISPQYTVGVWVGNADGEGRPGLTGVNAAAPLLFNVFDLLKPESWFQEPFDELLPTSVCIKSGALPSRHCKETKQIGALASKTGTSPCPYHTTVQLDETESYRVSAQCYSFGKIVAKDWFVLPPELAYYYKKKHPEYKDLPPFMNGCENTEPDMMSFVYPKNISKVYVPRGMDGKRGEVVFEVAHRQNNVKLYWHLNKQYIGTTEEYHQMGFNPPEGNHTITVVDELGNSISKNMIFK